MTKLSKWDKILIFGMWLAASIFSAAISLAVLWFSIKILDWIGVL